MVIDLVQRHEEPIGLDVQHRSHFNKARPCREAVRLLGIRALEDSRFEQLDGHLQLIGEQAIEPVRVVIELQLPFGLLDPCRPAHDPSLSSIFRSRASRSTASAVRANPSTSRVSSFRRFPRGQPASRHRREHGRHPSPARWHEPFQAKPQRRGVPASAISAALRVSASASPSISISTATLARCRNRDQNMSTYLAVVAFDRDRNGILAPQETTKASSVESAMRRARQLSFRHSGAMVFQRTIDPGTGRSGKGEVVASYGLVDAEVLGGEAA